MKNICKTIPRIVKFSGGRSSGMMLMQLLKKGKLKPKRGDVVIFNNTSAEHPATYKFIRKMKALTEQKYNIPFFWVEYQTYEDASRQQWTRFSSYRLVNDQPYSDSNEQGYHYSGEVFEEMISYSAHVPNMQARICTQKMKIFTTNAFLSDWLAQQKGIKREGHFGEESRMTDTSIVKIHKNHRGSTPDKILLAKKAFVRTRPFVREAALWQDFTSSQLCFNNKNIKNTVVDDKVKLHGDTAVLYISYLGIRKDEEIRIRKIEDRIEHAKNNKSASLNEQPPKEKVIAPLVESNTTKEDVIKFWKKQNFDLELPDTGLLSNCVYCPLKGKNKLMQIAKQELYEGNSNEDSPASIDWWIKVENKYSRNLKAEKRNITSKKDVNQIGFFGAADKPIYQWIKEQALSSNLDVNSTQAEYLEDESYIPCNCTD